MATSADDLQKMLEWAKQNDDQEAVDAVSAEIARQQNVRPREGALPEHQDQDPIPPSELGRRQGALTEEPTREPPGALRRGTAEKPWTPEEYTAAGEQYKAREREIAEQQYRADQEWLKDPASRPSRQQFNEFIRDPKNAQYGSSAVNTMRQQAVVDQETGKVRWTAMSPEFMDHLDEKGSTAGGVIGALAYGTTRLPGAALENVEAAQADRNNFQLWLLTGEEGLPKAEQERVLKALEEKYGPDHKYVKNPGMAPSREVRQLIDQNPDNEKEWDRIKGNEWWEQRKEFMGRGLARLASGWSYGVPAFGFGLADDPGGALTGAESYQGIEYDEGEAPAFAGASEMLRDWQYESEQTPGIYEHLIAPLVVKKTGETPGQVATRKAEEVRQHFYTEEQEAERSFPLLNPNKEISSLWDFFEGDTYADPDTKIRNPESLLLMFLENAPELAASMFVTRGAGGMAARAAAKESYGLTVGTMNRARETAAGRAGILAGGSSEGILVQQHLEKETRDILATVPIETWREYPLFQKYVESGMSEEVAMQILTQDAASKTGTSAAVMTILTGSVMNRFIGRSAAGRLIQDRPGLRRTAGALGEPSTEAAQEIGELLYTEAAVRPIDPDNPIYDDPNRYWETGLSAFIVSSPFGVAAGMEPSQPQGMKKEDVAAARAASRYMKATNERFAYEAKIADPDHIANTTPNQRLQELEKLEGLQEKEAQSILDAEPKMRPFLEKQNSVTAQTELKMLGALVRRANAMKNDIATARSKRTTATELYEAEQQVLQDRADLQRRVNERIVKLEDLQSQAAAIESVSKQESITLEQEQGLIKDGYAKRTKDGRVLLKPKGRRAMTNLNRQIAQLEGRLEAGYTGTERRDPINQVKRDLIESAGPVEREQLLFEDPLTGVQNRRAFNERQENIDVKEGQEPAVIENAQPAVAAVDVDSLKWVNDNMSHSAGDRLLAAVADALNKQEGVEVFRLGGDEFAVTGASEAALEEALQKAAAELSETQIAAGEDVVTPQMTWGKGATYTQADAQSLEMKQDRQQRGIRAKREAQPATYRVRSQQGLFQKDDGSLYRTWDRARTIADRGDSVEILTPDGAVMGIVTGISHKRGRPRMQVNVQGRSFTFNPDNNHLIVHPLTDPADLAWITGDAEYAQPDRETFPQVIPQVQIGHMSTDGIYYADLAQEYEPDVPVPWWMSEYPQLNYHATVPLVPRLPIASAEKYAEAEAVIADLTNGYDNLPPINIVRDMAELQNDAPHIVAQIRAEGGSLTGVRGYMDHINPQNGIYIFVPNIYGIVGSDNFKMGVAETIMHEMIGHYGVRGFFGNELDLRPWMHETVDMFPRLAKHYAQKLGLNPADPADKQLIGEEMVAYIAGQVYSGEMNFTPRQKKWWQKLMDWFRGLIARKGWDRWAPLKKMVTLNDTKEMFWNDSRIQELISRSQDFVRNGKGFEWRALNENSVLYMRDKDIFQAGLVNAINTGTRKLSKKDRRQMAQGKKYGGDLELVPLEVPLFAETGNINAYKTAIDMAVKEGYLTKRELELSGLSESSDFYLFRDGSYNTLKSMIMGMNGGKAPTGWYRGVLPHNLAQELDDINAAMEKNWMSGPLPSYATELDRPSLNKASATAMRERIAEIMAMKIDPKKANLSRELLLGHMASENAFRVFVQAQDASSYQSMSSKVAARRLFGDDFDFDIVTPEQKELIKAERERTEQRGPWIGYDAEQDRWLDWAYHSTEYSEWSPQGSRYTNDFRVALIKTEGAGTKMGIRGHYDQNLMHIRTGIAELLDPDQMDLSGEMTWPNPDMKGRLLSMIELQSDWLQVLRRGFGSHDEKSEADQQLTEDRQLLSMTADQLGVGVGADIWKVFDDALKPILNVPSDASGEYHVGNRRGTLFESFTNFARETYGFNWEELTADQQSGAWKDFVAQEMDKLLDPWNEASKYLEDTITELKKTYPSKLPGTMDVRAFEALDNLAINGFLQIVLTELNAIHAQLNSELRYPSNQAQLVSYVNNFKSSLGTRMGRVARAIDSGASYRLPVVTYRLKPILDELYRMMGADPSRVAELMSGMSVREQVTVRIPSQTIKDLNTAFEGQFGDLGLAQEIFSGSRISRHSDIPPGQMMMTPVLAGDEFIDIKVVGNKADVSAAEELVPKLISTWIENHAKEKLRANRERAQQGDTELGDADQYTYSDMEDFYNLEEHDVEEGGGAELSAHGVSTYYNFEEEHLGEAENDIVNEAFNRMDESDWDDLEDDHPGVSRQGDTYREAIVIDADGDTDNEAAEDALREAREEYRMEEMYQDEDLTMQAYEQVRDLWYERGPTALITGSLPTQWDEDNEPVDYVSIVIRAKDPGDPYDILIDDEEYDYNYSLDDSKEALADQIHSFYENSGIIPPYEVPFGPSDSPPTAEQPTGVEPNWDIVTSNIVENVSMMSDKPQKLKAVFERMVTLTKKLGYGNVSEPSPLSKDELWRPLALKYLISDAVRRGLGGVMWNNGTSSSSRGGWGISDADKTDRIRWSKEIITSRGEEVPVYLIHTPNHNTPIAVAPNRLVPVLGRNVVQTMMRQEAGELESAAIETPEGEDVADPKDDYLVATTEQGTMAIYRRNDNVFMGFASDQTRADEIIEQDIAHNGAPQVRDQGFEPAEPLGEVQAHGVITSDMIGGHIFVMRGSKTSGYRHTYDQPKVASARQSYEEITVRIWNKELKKYGTEIKDTYVKAADMRKATEDEGQLSRPTETRDEKIEEEHGRLYVAETAGSMHHWIVMSEKKGPIINDVFESRSRAQRRLDNYIEENYGSDKEGVLVMYFPITDQMREEFSKPVAPFHYDPTQDPALKDAAKKVGYEKTPLRERFSIWQEGFWAEFQQGALDGFYGLKKALNEAEVSDGSYVSARLTTSLDSMMKGVLYNGHPVFKDGIVQNEGRGLAEIFQPIMNDPDTWGLYMAGRRSKELMMEGYERLDANQKAALDAAAAAINGEVFDVLAMFHAETLYDHIPVQADDLSEAERGSLTKTELKFWSKFLPHTKRAMQPKKGSTTKAPAGRWQIFDWRVPSKRNTQQNIDSKYRMAIKSLMGRGYRVQNEAEARKIVDKLTDLALAKQAQADAGRDARVQAGKVAGALVGQGREHLFKANEIKSMVALGDSFPQFERVANDWAAFNKNLLDFAESMGTIDPEGRKVWESAAYVPFFRVDDSRLIGSSLSPSVGIANQRAPIRRLRGGEAHVGDIMTNIMMGVTKLVDGAVKNNAALEAIDALRGSGIISPQPMQFTSALVPLPQVKKLLEDKGIDPRSLSNIELTGIQKMMAIEPPEGPGIISVLRNGKREYYKTDDMLLWRSMAMINKKAFGRWMALFRAPKRLLTEWITITPMFMARNFIRDTGSSFVISRDPHIPVASAAEGFMSALVSDETMRTLVGAGAAFENGYITGGDPNQTRKILREAMKSPSFTRSVLDTPLKLYRAWKHIGSSIENANRIGIYNAARRSGKSVKRAAFESKDLMDFSMGGDWPFIQFLIQTVPFMNARAQGNYRLVRGARENPVGFTIKGFMVAAAGMALYLAFRDDERYKELEMWDKHSFYHWWIGDIHYRMPKPFEVGAIFNTIPEMGMEYALSKETDAGKILAKGWGHMLAETFNMNPMPQTVKPIFESAFNHNFFTDRPIVSYYEQNRLPPDQYRSRTSPTMMELARMLPSELDTVSGKIRSPLHLQNLYAGYTGTLGRYILMAADAQIRRQLDYPLPPAWETRDYPVYGDFVRGDNPSRRTKYETQVYELLNKTTAIQGSLSFHEKFGNAEKYLETHSEYEPYIRAAGSLESVRENIQEVNRAVQMITLDTEMTPEQKQQEIDVLEETRNSLFYEAWKLRPGGEYNPEEGAEPVGRAEIIDLIDQWGVDDSTAFMRHIEEDYPDTYELLEMIQNDMASRQLESLAKLGRE